MNDPRIAPVEDNLITFYTDALSSPVLQVADLDGAKGYYTDIPFPLCNVVFDARFDEERAGEQTRAVLDQYVGRGLPFLWWATPSTTSPGLELACAEIGMMREDVPAMHRVLDRPVDPPLPDGVRLELATADQIATFTATMIGGFGMPDFLHQPMQVMFAGLDQTRLVNVLAYVDDQPVACGTTYITGGTAGIYNIATLPQHRGRGIGYAVTAWLLDDALERGCGETILHATADGFPIYERLGYETVCTFAEMIWIPQG